MSILLVHGAFRGGWAWAPVRRLLAAAGHDALAPSLPGMGEHTPPEGGRGSVTLAEWAGFIARLVELEDLTDVVLAGHSQGGLVARAAAPLLGERLAAIAYLDAPIPRAGQRGIDLLPGPPPDPSRLPPPDTWLAPTPLVADDLHPADMVEWVNARLGPTPLGPSLDAVEGPEPSVAFHVAFCAHTPPGYPSWSTRRRMDEAGQPYHLFDAPHHVPLTHPDAVAWWLAGIYLLRAGARSRGGAAG